MNDIEKVIKILEGANRNPNNYISSCGCCMPSENLCFDNQLSMAVCIAISSLEKQLNNGWIPISERLPEEYGLYIVSVYYSEWICDYGTEDEIYKKPESIVLTAEYCKSMKGSHKWILHETDGEITVNGNEKIFNNLDYWSTYIKAWQSLPLAYKAD